MILEYSITNPCISWETRQLGMVDEVPDFRKKADLYIRTAIRLIFTVQIKIDSLITGMTNGEAWDWTGQVVNATH